MPYQLTDRETIGVMDLDTNKFSIIIDTDLVEPRAIAVDPRDDQGWMYFSDKHGIYRAGLDGAGNMTLIDNDVFDPNGLSIGR